MYKNLPPELVTTVAVAQNIKAQAFYYYITFTVFGEVLKVENDFDDLPDIARKLIVGKNQSEDISREHFSMDEFQYLIPLIAVGCMGVLPEWLKSIENRIQQLQKNITLPIKENPQNYISSQWIIDLLKHVKINKGFFRISIHLQRILLRKNIRLNVQLMYNEEVEIATPILIGILEKNWEDEALSAAIIRGLARTKNDEAFQLLKKIFTDENLSVQTWIIARKALQRMDKTRMRGLIYDGLQSSDTKRRLFSIECMINFLEENEVIEILTNLYKHDPDFSIKIKAIEALSYKKDNSEFIDLLAIELDIGTNEKLRFAAVKALKMMNCEKSIAVLEQYYY